MVKNREVALGGCVIEAMSPAYCGICADCGAQYDAATKVWTIRSEDPHFAFPEPLAWPLLELPVLKKMTFTYEQEIKKREVVSQSSSALCTMNQKEETSYTKSIERILNAHHVAYRRTEDASVNRTINYQWLDAKKHFEIKLEYYPPDSVRINITCEEKDYWDKVYGNKFFSWNGIKKWPGYVPLSSLFDENAKK